MCRKENICQRHLSCMHLYYLCASTSMQKILLLYVSLLFDLSSSSVYVRVKYSSLCIIVGDCLLHWSSLYDLNECLMLPYIFWWSYLNLHSHTTPKSYCKTCAFDIQTKSWNLCFTMPSLTFKIILLFFCKTWCFGPKNCIYTQGF